MSDITLNPTLTARFKAVQQHWGHDSLGETIATVLDGVIHRWDIPAPNTPNIMVDKSARIRLKPRHVGYFTQMSAMSGLNVTEVVRGVLIQWVCSPQNTLLLPDRTQMSRPHTRSLSQSTHKRSPSTRRTTKETEPEAKQETIQHEVVQSSPQTVQISTEQTQEPTKTTGRSALSGLLRKE